MSARGIAAVAAHVGFAVHHVAVAGRGRTNRQAILDALGVQRGTPILAVDLDAAKARLEALAWVHAAEVERRLPDTIFVRLVEREPLAFWQRHGKLVLIDRDGRVVPTDRLDAFGSLIVLVGDDVPKTATALLGDAGRASRRSMPMSRPRCASATGAGTCSSTTASKWRCRRRTRRALGTISPPSTAATRLLERAIVAVDLRLPDRLVVRLPPAPPKAAPTKKAKGGKAT